MDLHRVTEHAPVIIFEIISIKCKAIIPDKASCYQIKTICEVGLINISFIVGISENLYKIKA